jgi:hypothetical protein
MQISANIRWGIVWGTVFAAFFTGVVLVEYLIFGNGPFVRNGVTLGSTIATYFTAGYLGGIVVGIARPFAQSHRGAVISGIVTGTVVYGTAMTTIIGSPVHWQFRHWLACLLPGIVVGGLMGDRIWSNPIKAAKPLPRK